MYGFGLFLLHRITKTNIRMVILLIQKHCFSYTVLYGWISYIPIIYIYL